MMHPDGVCQLSAGSTQTKPEYEDINYSVAYADQTAIFGGWSSFLTTLIPLYRSSFPLSTADPFQKQVQGQHSRPRMI